jgi:hypothetical protein
MTVIKLIFFVIDTLIHFGAIFVLLHFVTIIIINRLLIKNYRIVISILLLFICVYILHIYIQSVHLFHLVKESTIFMFVDSFEGIARVILTIGLIYHGIMFKYIQSSNLLKSFFGI